MALASWVAMLMLLALSAYAVLGIADFGGGVWDLFARGPRARAQRKAIANAMGPVWEANHVWLVFFLILMMGAFPKGYSTLSVAMFIPFHLVLLGIILRGAAFVFRSPGTTAATGQERVWSYTFGIASTVTPLLLGMAVGAVSSGGIRIVDGTVMAPPAASWLSPFAWGMGLFVLTLAAYLAAVYLMAETEGDLQRDFHRRAIVSGTVTAVLSGVMLFMMARYTPWLWDRFTHDIGSVLLSVGGLLMILSFVFVVGKKFILARVTAAGQVIVLLWGWAMAQWPYIIYPSLTFMDAKAPDATLRFILQIMPLGMLLLLPSLWLLFRVFKGAQDAGDEA